MSKLVSPDYSRELAFPAVASNAQEDFAPGPRADWKLLCGLAGATIVVHLLVANRYGFNRDEFSILEDARHLAWGYVPYPPLAPFIGRLALALFGSSLIGFRFFSALAQAIGIVLAGAMAKEMGGGRFAQAAAACAGVPFALGLGALLQYSSFDYFAWVLTAYCVLKLFKTRDPRYFLLIGASIGLGMLAKYTMIFFAAGVLAGIAFTGERKYLRTVWPWLGMLVSLALFAPDFLWLVRHHFVSYDFLRFIHQRDVAEGLTKSFVLDQVVLTSPAFPLWLAGLYFCLVTPEGRSFRPLAWMYLVPLLLLFVAKGRWYYLAPAYPMLYAAGGVYIERLIARWPAQRAVVARAGIIAVLLLGILGAAPFALPLAPIGSPWFHLAEKVNITLRDEIGWQDLIATLARVRDSLPAESQAQLGILAENYGEVGSINLYGPARGLPRAISGVNSSWERGYGNPPPQVLLIVGFSREFVEANFTACRLVAQNTNSYGIANEESTERRDIFLCGPPKLGWPQFWKTFQYFA